MWISLIIIVIVILDQYTKNLAITNLQPLSYSEFLPGFLSFHYHENKGAAWGMLSDSRWVFMTASSIAILFIIFYFLYMKIKKEKVPLLLSVSLSFFCGGGIGNMIDRVAYGYVVDFLKFEFIDFPIFNVADSFITIGAILIMIYIVSDFIHDLKKKKTECTND